MKEECERVDDVVAELRLRAELRRKSGKLLTIDDTAIDLLADRIEAAHKRDISEKEYVIQAVESARTSEVSKLKDEIDELKKQVGNMAKLREALKQVNKLNDLWFDTFTLPDGATSIHDEIENVISDALAAPPRNCDLARDWMRDLYAHFQPPASIKREMPPEWVDAVMAFCRWLLAPATEKESEVQG